MNRKQFFILLAALAVVTTAGLLVLNRHKQSWSVREAKVGEKLLANFRPNDVAAIHIKSGLELNIENKDGAWRVRERGNYPANYEHVKSLLVRMKDIKIVQSDEIGPSQRPRVDREVDAQKPDSWWYKRASGGGSLLDYLGYGATLGTWYMNGAAPIEVTSVVDETPGIEVDQRVVGSLHLGDVRRPRVQLDCGMVCEPRERRRAVRDEVELTFALGNILAVPARTGSLMGSWTGARWYASLTATMVKSVVRTR